MQQTMLKPKMYGADDRDELEHHDPRVVHLGAHNKILTVDQEVATLRAAPTSA